MKTKFGLILLFLLSIISPLASEEIDCNEFNKLSAKYIECSAKKMTEKASEKIGKGKKKINESEFGEKIDKFKKSKTLSDLIKN